MLSRVSVARIARPTKMVGRRSLYVHEYAAKDLMGKYNVDYQRGNVVSNANEVGKAFNDVNTKLKVIKAQILAGGRGKGSFIDGYKKGVQITDDAKKAQEIVGRMLGNRLRTAQTRGGLEGEGVPVNKVFIAECLDIQKEYYFAIVLEGKAQGAVMVGSAEGGVEIEEVQKKNPAAIITQNISWKDGLSFAEAKKFAQKVGFEGQYVDKAADSMVKLYKLMIESDATQVEINPFAETPDGRVVCIDAKINFDDNASHRQESIFALRDPTQDDPKEVEAEKFNLNYVALDGNIACLVNGAGLAMSTMDMIKMYGAEPANFLDVGGSATKEAVSHAFKIITSDSRVKGILVNIFGGIMKCDVIAEGIVAAAKDIEIKVPLVVRLAGTNQEKGSKIIENSGLAITAAKDLDDAAKKIVELSKKQ